MQLFDKLLILSACHVIVVFFISNPFRIRSCPDVDPKRFFPDLAKVLDPIESGSITQVHMVNFVPIIFLVMFLRKMGVKVFTLLLHNSKKKLLKELKGSG